MSTIRPRTRFHPPLLGLLSMLAACADGPVAPPMEEPVEATLYDLEVKTRFIRIHGTCDENVFGASANGEFQYFYRIRGDGGQWSRGSTNYGKVYGQSFSRGVGDLIDFTNRTYTFETLPRDAEIVLTFFGSEWDGVKKDSDMDDVSTSQTVPFATGENTHDVGVGADDCHIRLVYDARWRKRQ